MRRTVHHPAVSRTALSAVLLTLLVMLAPPGLRADAEESPTLADLVGHWQGTLEVGEVQLQIVFHFSESSDGEIEATMDSPDQGATGIPVTSVTLEGKAVRLEVESIGGVYTGELAESRTAIEGEWQQGGMTLPLRLEQVEEVARKRRPQEPRPPYPYREEEVEIEVPGAGVTLAGTLTLPSGDGPHPAVALVSGSGPQDRDETLYGHRPFLVLSDHLTRQGVAVLRMDDRGFGGSSGSTFESTLADRTADTLAAVRYLRRRSELDRGRIGLVGHSEGGWVLPLAAREAPDEIAFLVFLAGPGQSPRELLRSQQRALLEAEGADEATITALQTLQERGFEVLEATPDIAEAETRLEGLREEVASELPEAQRRALETRFAGESDATRAATIEAANSAWFRDLLAFDPAPALRQIRQPVLALYGGNDLQVPAEGNAAAMRRLLREGHAEHAIQVLPGLNHLFQPSRSGLPAEYATIETTIAPEVLERISGWITETTQSGE